MFSQVFFLKAFFLKAAFCAACLLALAKPIMSAEQQHAPTKENTTNINWNPTVLVKLQAQGLCVFVDQGYIFIIYDSKTQNSLLEESSFWAEHTLIEHPEATIHVVKPTMAFSMRITPELDVRLSPSMWGEPILSDTSAITYQKKGKSHVWDGLQLKKSIAFVHEGRRFLVVLTSKPDGGFHHQQHVRPYFRTVPSMQGLAMQVDSDIPSICVAENHLSISSRLDGYYDTQHTFWSQLARYGRTDVFPETKEPAFSLCKAMWHLRKNDAASADVTLKLLFDKFPLVAYHPLAARTQAWVNYLFRRPVDMHYLLQIDGAENWQGIYADYPLCFHNMWERVRWNMLPQSIFQKVWASALEEAHRCQSFVGIRALLNEMCTKMGPMLKTSFYKTVLAQVEKPHLFKDMLKGFVERMRRAGAVPPGMEAWARYYQEKDHMKLWNPFVPLWQLHKDMEQAFKARRFKEVLQSVVTTPFNPILGDVFKAILDDETISEVEKIGLYERIKTSLPIKMRDDIVSRTIELWITLNMPHEASQALISNQSVINTNVKCRLWILIAERYAARELWSDVEYSLKQVTLPIPQDCEVIYLMQKANWLWKTGKKDEAMKIWQSSSELRLIHQSADLLMQDKRYKEAADQWAVVVNHDKKAVRPYAVCLWYIGDEERLQILQKTNSDDPWLRLLLESFTHPNPTVETAEMVAKHTVEATQKILSGMGGASTESATAGG